MKFQFEEMVCDLCAIENGWDEIELEKILQLKANNEMLSEFWKDKLTKCVNLGDGKGLCKKHIQEIIDQFTE